MNELFASETVRVATMDVEGAEITVVSVSVPGSGSWTQQLRGTKGMILCGAFSTDFVDGRDTPFAIFKIPQVEAVLDAPAVHLNPAALAMGATPEMSGTQILKLFA